MRTRGRAPSGAPRRWSPWHLLSAHYIAATPTTIIPSSPATADTSLSALHAVWGIQDGANAPISGILRGQNHPCFSYETGLNVFDAWGGAYDLIHLDTGGYFRYLDEYTIVLRLLDVDELDKGIQLSNVLKYQRRDEVSLMAILNNGKLDFFGAKDITASEEPISATIDKDLTMTSRVNMSIIGVGRDNRFMLPLLQIDGLAPTDNGRQTVFMDFDDEGRLRVVFIAEHDKRLEEQTLSYFAKYAHRWS